MYPPIYMYVFANVIMYPPIIIMLPPGFYLGNFFLGGGKAISPQVNTITTTVQSQEYTGGKLPPCPPSLDRTLMYQQIRWVWWNDLDISPFRVLGSLLTAHLLIIDPDQRLGPLAPQDYDNELLHMAHDLANRLLPAFDNTTTGLPHPRVC